MNHPVDYRTSQYPTSKRSIPANYQQSAQGTNAYQRPVYQHAITGRRGYSEAGYGTRGYPQTRLTSGQEPIAPGYAADYQRGDESYRDENYRDGNYRDESYRDESYRDNGLRGDDPNSSRRTWSGDRGDSRDSGEVVYEGTFCGPPVYELPYPPPDPVLDRHGRVEMVPTSRNTYNQYKWFSWEGSHTPRTWVLGFLLPIAAVAGVVLGVRLQQDSTDPP